jgi:DNA-binding transcriptional LysR family regulator
LAFGKSNEYEQTMKRDYAVQRGTLDGVEAFVRVAERRSFRGAAADLGVTPSAVSQAVRALEARVGIALFTRTTRSVGLTEAGERFLERALPAFQEILAASNAARELGAKPSGLLRIAVPRAAVPLVLQPLLASFSAAYPDIAVEIAASEKLVDLAKEGFDAGIRMGELIANDMVAIRLTPPFRFIVVGSPAYFTRRGRPRTPAELAAHSCIRLRRSNGALATWRLKEGSEMVDLSVSGSLIVHDFPTMLEAALSGAALAQVPEPVAAEHLSSGRLEEALARHAPLTSGLFLYFPDRKQVLPKLRAFIEHARSFTQDRQTEASETAKPAKTPKAGARRVRSRD